MSRQTKAQLEARIAELEAENARLSELTMCDPLTGVYNRRAFRECLGRETAAARRNPNHPVGLLIIDLNDFKSVNDTYGHQAGDVALKLVAEVAQACVRTTDVVCRIGGDEFAVILHAPVDSVGVSRVAWRIAEALADRPLAVGETSVAITVSIGGAFASEVIEIGSLFTRADAALMGPAKKAKRPGYSPVVCS